ncbi:hypothetical protein V1L54_01735 [Streptomyces sp. TRM 70361]|uniref:SCO2584 family spore wall biosynthesis protein n=1 Tax=Streptomyces sp. TRM 70361 TaxID=3116553 RepID=UPI002E7C17C6|nr:hypothetical protein [Streptomyces sp. TRM 70361]MEE1938150.1 hypothetical protein [Streptomyces sp. TRM 70361]
MPEDVGGQPYPNGEEPEDRDRTAADDAFASVVFDESFVRAAPVHEPTAAERILAAAQSAQETEAAVAYEEQYGYRPLRDDPEGSDHDPDADEDEGRYGRYRYGRVEFVDRVDYVEYVEDAEYPQDAGFAAYTEDYEDCEDGHHGHARRSYRGHARWHRPVAWVLAVVMGVGIVGLAFAAVYRGAAGHRQQPPTPPPATTGVSGVSGADTSSVGGSGALPPLSTRHITSSLRHPAPRPVPVPQAPRVSSAGKR